MSESTLKIIMDYVRFSAMVAVLTVTISFWRNRNKGEKEKVSPRDIIWTALIAFILWPVVLVWEIWDAITLAIQKLRRPRRNRNKRKYSAELLNEVIENSDIQEKLKETTWVGR